MQKACAGGRTSTQLVSAGFRVPVHDARGQANRYTEVGGPACPPFLLGQPVPPSPRPPPGPPFFLPGRMQELKDEVECCRTSQETKLVIAVQYDTQGPGARQK
jgi:hypothetical protein